MEYLINAANALYLLAYFVRDMLWLRAFTIVGASLLAVYFYLLPEPVMTAVYWNFLFGTLNAYHLLRLVASRPSLRVRGRDHGLLRPGGSIAA